MKCSQPRVPARVMAPFIAFALGMAGMAVIANQPAPSAASDTVTAAPITADRTAVIGYDSPTVQAWTPGQDDDPTVVDPATVQEDDPGWDCHIHGNKICGEGTAEAPQVDPVPSGAPGDTCEEDEPCWDCETMGNQVCGSIDDSAEAWATWDEVGASRGVSDGSFRVDYVASTPEYPQNLTVGDIPLLGANGTWYVFHVVDGTELPANTEEPADMS